MVCEGSWLLSQEVPGSVELVVHAKDPGAVLLQHSFLWDPPRNQHSWHLFLCFQHSFAPEALHCFGIRLLWSKGVYMGIICLVWVLCVNLPAKVLLCFDLLENSPAMPWEKRVSASKALVIFLIFINVLLTVVFHVFVQKSSKQMHGDTLFSSSHTPIVVSIFDWWYRDCHFMMKVSMSRFPWLKWEILFFCPINLQLGAE